MYTNFHFIDISIHITDKSAGFVQSMFLLPGLHEQVAVFHLILMPVYWRQVHSLQLVTGITTLCIFLLLKNGSVFQPLQCSHKEGKNGRNAVQKMEMERAGEIKGGVTGWKWEGFPLPSAILRWTCRVTSWYFLSGLPSTSCYFCVPSSPSLFDY